MDRIAIAETSVLNESVRLEHEVEPRPDPSCELISDRARTMRAAADSEVCSESSSAPSSSFVLRASSFVKRARWSAAALMGAGPASFGE